MEANAGIVEMVRLLKAGGYVKSKSVEKAMLSIDRALFMPHDAGAFAYRDIAYPIGKEQTITAPSVVAFMCEALEIKKGMKILEVGTGSGYNCAMLAELAGWKGKVVTVEIFPELSELAKNNIAKQNIAKRGKKKNRPQTAQIEFVAGDGSVGYEKEAPYDRICVTASVPQSRFNEHNPLIKQLKPQGKLIAPVGESKFGQDLILYDKKTKSSRPILPVLFVPLVGKGGWG